MASDVTVGGRPLGVHVVLVGADVKVGRLGDRGKPGLRSTDSAHLTYGSLSLSLTAVESRWVLAHQEMGTRVVIVLLLALLGGVEIASMSLFISDSCFECDVSHILFIIFI